jgi:hypothetical protein
MRKNWANSKNIIGNSFSDIAVYPTIFEMQISSFIICYNSGLLKSECTLRESKDFEIPHKLKYP